MCFDNTESESNEQTLQFQSHPRPSCSSVYLKLQVQLFCGEPEKTLLSDDLSDFRVRTHTFICLYAIWKRLWVISYWCMTQSYSVVMLWVEYGLSNVNPGLPWVMSPCVRQKFSYYFVKCNTCHGNRPPNVICFVRVDLKLKNGSTSIHVTVIGGHCPSSHHWSMYLTEKVYFLSWSDKARAFCLPYTL